MATYYWVGGAGTWDATDTTHWATSIGGAGGAGVPTAADNAEFNSLSNATAYAVTVGTNAVAQDVTIAGPLVGTVTLDFGTTGVINCYGSWTNASSNVAFTAGTGGTAAVNFLATTTGKTVTTNNVTLQAAVVTFNGVGGGWTLGSAFTNTVSNFVLAGSFSTGGFAYTAANLTASGTLTRVVSLGASTLTLSANTPINITNTTNLTFNAGTSTITCTAASPTFNGNGQTFYNVSFTNAASGTTSILGANTFNNVTQTSRSAAGQRIVSLDSNITVSGTLTLQTLGTPVATQRTVVWSSVIGTRRTITAAALSGMTDVDFRDIAGAGAASWTGTRIGNLLNNTGITFTTGVNKYWNLAAGGNWSSTAWALSAGGAVAVANFPLAQDTVNIDLTTITSGSTINISVAWQVPTVICTRPSGSNTLVITSVTGSPQFYGNWTSCAGMSFTAPTNAWEFVGQGLTQTITSASIPFTQGFTVNSPGGTVRLADNLTTGTGATLSLTTGTLDLNSKVLSVGIFSGAGSLARGITSGSGTITITGTNTTVVTAGTTTSMTVDVRPTFNLTTSPAVTTGTRTITWGASSNLPAVPNINVTNGSDTFNTSGTSTVNNLNLSGFTGTFGNATRNIYGNLTMNGTMTAVTAGTSGTTFIGVGSQTITSAGQGLNFPIAFDGVGGTWTLQDALTVGPIGSDSTRTTTLTNGTLVLNGFNLSTGQFSSSNTNTRTLNFGSNKIIVTGANGTVFNMGTSTNLTFSGTPQVEATGTAGTAGQLRTLTPPAVGTNLETLAVSVRVTAGVDTISLATTSSAYGNVEFTSGFTGTVQMTNAIVVYGDWTFGANMVTPTTSTGSVTFASTNATTRVITSNGKAFGGSSIVFSGVGGSWQLVGNFATGATNTITLTTGALDLNNYSATAGLFSASGTLTRSIAFGSSGKIVANYATANGTATVVTLSTCTGLTYTGTSRIEVTGNPSITPTAGTRTITGPQPTTGGSEANAMSIYVKAGSDIIAIGTAARCYGTIDFTGFGGTLQTNTAPLIFGDLVLSTGMTIPSTTNTNVWTFASTSGTTRTVTTNGKTLDFPLVFDGIGGKWAFQDALTLVTTRALTLTNGTLQLKSGTTNVVGSFVTPGTTQTYLQATTSGSQATISAPSGTNTATFITIQDSNATGGAVWQASNAVNPVNAGNNSGWNFATAISGVSATGSVGTVNLGITPSALTGVLATGSVGTVYIGWRDVNTTQTQTWTPVITS
jgi:hypothetical protein